MVVDVNRILTFFSEDEIIKTIIFDHLFLSTKGSQNMHNLRATVEESRIFSRIMEFSKK